MWVGGDVCSMRKHNGHFLFLNKGVVVVVGIFFLTIAIASFRERYGSVGTRLMVSSSTCDNFFT